MLTVSNIVSSKTGEGLVSIELDGKLIARLEVKSAQEFASNIMCCASVAETEANLLRFLSERLNRSITECAAILQEFRTYREN